MLTDDQLMGEIRSALIAETDGIDPRQSTLDRVRDQLTATPARRPRVRWLTFGADRVVIALAAAVAVAVAVIAVIFLHHSSPAPATTPVAVGTVRIAAHAPDPGGGLPWGLRTIQTGQHQACLRIGRLQSGAIGMLGQDGAFGNDRRFHPIPIHQNFPCAGTDANGHLFLNVFDQEIPASAASGTTTGCRPTQPPARAVAHLPKVARSSIRRFPTCPTRDLRNIAFGVLGPEAISVTYTLNGRTITEPTGPDGAYIAIVPGTTTSCTVQGAGRACASGGGEITTGTLQSGVITSVRYRDGQVCRLAAPGAPATPAPGTVETAPNTGTVPGVLSAPYAGTATGAVASSRPALGYAPIRYRVPHVTAAQVAAPMTVRTITAKRYCYKPVRGPAFLIPCDLSIPRGYKPAAWASGARALVDISFTARLAADNHHTVYEYSFGRASGPANCTLNTGGTDATTMLPIRAGKRVTIQDDQEVCPGTYTGLVTYQPNGGPGQDTLDWSRPIRDHSILVGRFTYVLRR